MSEKPQSWTSVTVEDLAAATPGSLTDGPFGSNLKTSHYRDTGPRVIRLQNIGDGSFLDERAHISPAHFEGLRKHDAIAGDVVVALLGEILPRACVVPANLGQAIVKADCARLRVDTGLSTGPYVANALNSHQLREQARERVHGVGRPRLGLKWLRTLEVPLAPIREQERIVAAVESYFSRLDDATATLEHVQRNLTRYRASLLKAAVEGRLVPTEAELARAEGRSYEPASVLLERILAERRRQWEETELAKMNASGRTPTNDEWKSRYEEPVLPDELELTALPAGWCWASMGQLTSRITSGSRDWTKYYGRGEAVFLMAQNVRPGRLDLSYKQLVGPPVEDSSRERSQVSSGDLLVTIVGANTGDVCRVPNELPQHYVCQSVALMRPVEELTSFYLDAYLNSPNGKQAYEKFMYGQGRPHLSFDNLRATPIPLPPLAEQVRIIQSVERLQTVVQAATDQVTLDEERCRLLRQSVLKWAFEGRLVDQDPADEPASVLLERIRSERMAPDRTDSTRRARASRRSRQSIPRDNAK